MNDSTEPADPIADPRTFLAEIGPESVVGILLVTGILAVMSIAVFFRYVLNDSLGWSEELARYGLVYVTFLGAALAARRGSHIRVSVLEHFLPPRWRRLLHLLQEVLTLAFVFTIAVLAIRISGILHGTKSAAMLLPMSYVYAAIVIGFGLAALRHAVVLWRTARR
ncbi:MAG: TRAP transporter small permease [Geminicoccaceae bacterium]